MKTIKIGRSSSNDAVIKDDVVSSNHALLIITDWGEISIEDLNSSNGTFVDGKRITKKTKLTSSSVVMLGNHTIDWKHIAQTSAQKPVKPSVVFPTNVVEKKSIGRNPSSNVRYSFDDVSDKHAYLCKCSDGNIVIVDNNSTNGTFVNGRRIISPYTLKKGDTITLSNKHPFNWEAIYRVRRTLNTKPTAIVAACAMVLVGLFIWQPWSRNWTKVYTDHKNDIVLVYVKSAYVVTAQGRLLSDYINDNSLDYISFDSEGNPGAGIAESTGTGFFISTDGRMLTNEHVVSDDDIKTKEQNLKYMVQDILREAGFSSVAANIEVKFRILSVGIAQNDTYINNESDLIPCTIVKVSTDEQLDVAILQTNTKSIPDGSTYVDLTKAVSSNDIKLGDEICTIGFPQSFTIGQTQVGLEANNQSGEVTQERGSYEYGHNITIHQGASGSPVYDRKGRFAGIIVSGFLGISQGYNHAIHPTPVLEFVGINQ